MALLFGMRSRYFARFLKGSPLRSFTEASYRRSGLVCRTRRIDRVPTQSIRLSSRFGFKSTWRTPASLLARVVRVGIAGDQDHRARPRPRRRQASSMPSIRPSCSRSQDSPPVLGRPSSASAAPEREDAKPLGFQQESRRCQHVVIVVDDVNRDFLGGCAGFPWRGAGMIIGGT